MDGRWFTISNGLTFLRIFLTPVIVGGITYNQWSLVFFLLLVAALTDFLDGYLARLLNQRSQLGACLDPIADKILLISCFTTLAFIDSPSFIIPFWFVILVLLRESIIVGGTLVLFALNVDVQISPSIAGKMTTLFQLVFIMWLFICYFAGWNPVKTYGILLILLALFSLGSLGQYGMIGVRYLYAKILRKR